MLVQWEADRVKQVGMAAHMLWSLSFTQGEITCKKWDWGPPLVESRRVLAAFLIPFNSPCPALSLGMRATRYHAVTFHTLDATLLLPPCRGQGGVG